MRPGVAPHLLANGEAQLAYNCKIHKGDLRAFSATGQIQATAVASPNSLYQYEENSNTHWVASAAVVHTVKSPVANEQYERLWFTGGAQMRFHANDKISGGGFDPAVDFFLAGIPAPTAAPTVARAGGAGTEYRAYFYARVNSYSDPGSRSPISNEIADYLSGRVTVTGIQDAPAERAINRIWLYRINATGKNAAEYQFVLEARWFDTTTAYAVGQYVVYLGALYECTTTHPAGAWNAGHFTAGEQVPNSALGTVWEYEDYLPPPDGLKGLCIHPSGSAVGYVGNAVYMSVPNRLHAWPLAYRRSQPYQVMGLAIVGSNVFVLKDGPPSRYYGQHPDSMAPYHYTDWLPCLAERTISSWKDEVYYRTKGGIAKLNASSAMLITIEQPGLQQIIDPDIWDADFIPLHGVFHNDLYFGHGAASSFYIDFGRRCCCWLSTHALASTISKIDGGMYMVVSEAGTNYIEKWEGDAQNCLQYTWRGRMELLHYETNMAYGLIYLDPTFYEEITSNSNIDLIALNAAAFAGYLDGDLGGDDELGGDIALAGDNLIDLSGFSISDAVTVKIVGDEQIHDNRSITGKRALFSFSAGWQASRLAVELAGYVPVLSIAIAESPEEVLYG